MAKKSKWSDAFITPRDQEVLDNAEYYTTFRFGGIGKRDKRKFDTLAEARADAGKDPKALVYAVMGNRDAIIRSDYQAPNA